MEAFSSVSSKSPTLPPFIMRPVDRATTRAFIQARLQDTGVDFPEGEVERILAESGGHPQKLMRLCSALYDRLTGGAL